MLYPFPLGIVGLFLALAAATTTGSSLAITSGIALVACTVATGFLILLFIGMTSANHDQLTFHYLKLVEGHHNAFHNRINHLVLRLAKIISIVNKCNTFSIFLRN